MKFNRIIVCLLLIAALLLHPAAALAAEGARSFTREENLAGSLKALGLFQGVADADFALDRAPTRTEALVMLLRLLGLESEARACTAEHPFTDTGDYAWADPYIAYAYSQGLTSGVSETAFGGGAAADARTYLTFVLRALGYSEGADGDFTWDSPFLLARRLQLLPAYVQTQNFLRADVVSVSYAALGAACKDGTVLVQALEAKGVFDRETRERYYDSQAWEYGRLSEQVQANVDAFLRPYRIAGGIDISGLAVKNYGSVLQIGDAAYEKYGFYAAGLDKLAVQMCSAAQAVGERGRVFSIVVPNRLGALLTDEDYFRLSGAKKTETEAIAYAYGQMDGVHTVDAISELRAHHNEDIFFRTDHHWSGLGAYYAYVAWAQTAGVEPVALESFSTLEIPGHLGLFYGMCGNPTVMKQNPDTVVAYIPPDIDSIRVEIQEADGGVHAGQLIVESAANGYGYGVFIGGDHPLTTITNDAIDDDSACVLVKDSYGNPFAVYLTQHYHTVYVIDYRYYKNVSGYLTFSRFAGERGVDDFIVLLPMTLSQSDSTASNLAKYCK